MEPSQDPVQVAVLVDHDVAGSPEREVVTGLEHVALVDELDDELGFVQLGLACRVRCHLLTPPGRCAHWSAPQDRSCRRLISPGRIHGSSITGSRPGLTTTTPPRDPQSVAVSDHSSARRATWVRDTAVLAEIVTRRASSLDTRSVPVGVAAEHDGAVDRDRRAVGEHGVGEQPVGGSSRPSAVRVDRLAAHSTAGDLGRVEMSTGAPPRLRRAPAAPGSDRYGRAAHVIQAGSARRRIEVGRTDRRRITVAARDAAGASTSAPASSSWSLGIHVDSSSIVSARFAPADSAFAAICSAAAAPQSERFLHPVVAHRGRDGFEVGRSPHGGAPSVPWLGSGRVELGFDRAPRSPLPSS